MITVHHLNNSRSQRVLWLLEELELQYDIVKYERDPTTLLAPASLRAIHPLGKSPVITDGDATLAESGAIVEYLVDTYGKGKLSPAPGTAAHRNYRYFLHYAEGSLMPFLLLRLITSRIRKAPLLVRPIAKAIAGKVDGGFVSPNLDRHVGFLASHLDKRTWFAGEELTAADAQMSFPMEAIVARVPDAPPVFKAWVDRMKARPAFQKAMERGGAYSVMD